MTLTAARTRTNTTHHAGRPTRRRQGRHTLPKPANALALSLCTSRAPLAGTIAADGDAGPQGWRTWNTTIDAAHWDVLLNLTRQ